MRPEDVVASRRFARIIAIICAAALALPALIFAPQAFAARVEATIWGDSEPPGVVLEEDRDAVTLGTTFTPIVDGTATGIRFYKVDGVTGSHTGVLWDGDGTRLATVSFEEETASGWQRAELDGEVQLTAGETYVVGYQVPAGGRYAATENVLANSESEALDVSTRGSGVYAYGPRPTLPRSTWRSSQYWVDVTFVPSEVPSETPEPTVTPSATPRPTPSSAPTAIPTEPPPAQAGAFPTAATAGIPAGWRPTQTVSGDYWVRTAGAVVEDLRISNGTIYVAAPNVTLRRIEGTNVRVYNYAGASCGTGLLVEDSSFYGSRANDGQSVIGDGGYTVRNVKIDGASEGLRAGYARECGGVTVEKSFIHVVPPAQCGDWHGDGIQGYGGGKLTVRDSTILFEERNGCYGTAAFFYPANQGNTSVDIDGLLVSGGGYPFRLGMPGSVKNLNIVNKGWGYGPMEVNCSLVEPFEAKSVALNILGQVAAVVAVLPCR